MIERFLDGDGKITYGAYEKLVGTQSNHWCYVLSIAACHYKLGHMEECGRYIDYAYYIISHAWGKEEWETNAEYYLEIYRKEYRERGLEAFRPLDV